MATAAKRKRSKRPAKVSRLARVVTLVKEGWLMIGIGAGAATLLVAGILWSADMLRSDHPPEASISRVKGVEAAAAQSLRVAQNEVAKTFNAIIAQNALQAQVNAQNAQGWCDLYSGREADARARAAKSPTDAQALRDVISASQSRAIWCGQLPPPPAPPRAP